MANSKLINGKIDMQAYLMEAAGIGGFVIFAGLLTIYLEHPSLPVMRSSMSQHIALRRIILGIAMGLYIAGTSTLFKRSGAHMNPSVTIAFLSLGKITSFQAVMYVLFQVAGASFAALLLSNFTGGLFAHPLINYAMTEPRPPHGMLTAFVAECIISFIMMFAVLVTASSKRFEKYVPLVCGICLALFIAVELPFSGMSMNPARSFAASLAADKWKHLWIYFTAPVISMLVAADIFLRWKKKASVFSGIRDKINTGSVHNEDYREIPHYPLKKEEK